MKKINIEGTSVLIREPSQTAQKALILLHGRGASAEDIISITDFITLPDSCIVMAPQAPGNTWYPHRFLIPQQENQPSLSSSLENLHQIIAHISTQYRIPAQNTILMGFSQGGCLVAEYLKRHAQSYGGAVIASGGLIGTDQEASSLPAQGSLNNTPIYLGCDRNDPHIPIERVLTSQNILQSLNGAVTTRIYNNFGHTIHKEALSYLSDLLHNQS